MRRGKTNAKERDKSEGKKAEEEGKEKREKEETDRGGWKSVEWKFNYDSAFKPHACVPARLGVCACF